MSDMIRLMATFNTLLDMAIAEARAAGLSDGAMAGCMAGAAGQMWRRLIPDEGSRRAFIMLNAELQITGKLPA